jgi:photosystem II stability/assembly factor-like uncharacterized protein
MKTKLLIIVTIMLLACPVLLKAQTWELVNSFSDYLTNVYTQGTDTVYIVGQNGFIGQSANRGKNWNYQHVTTNILSNVYFVSHNVGYVVGANGTILTTSNAGITWTTVTSNTTQNLNAVAATGINNIWAVGDNGIVIKSNDAGQTWNTVSITIQTPNFSDIGFKNGKGYIIGNLGSIYQTLDNGSSWTQQTNIEGYTGQEEFVCLSITENKVFIHSTNNPSIYKNNNNLWQKYNVPSYGIANSNDFLTDDQGFFTTTIMEIPTGSSPGYWVVDVFKTDNGGSNWSSYSDGSNNPISTQWIIGDTYSKIAFVNTSLGYLISGHYMYRIPFVGDINADFYAGITNQKQDIVGLNQGQNSLMINYIPKEISNVKVISTLGQIIFQQNVNNKNEVTVNTSDFINGTYIVQVNLKDYTQLSVKWIKH